MLTIINTDLYVTRGDSASLSVEIDVQKCRCSEPYYFTKGERLYFTVKKSTKTKDFLFQKVYDFDRDGSPDENTVVFKILPEDTENIPFGKYTYDVELITASKDKYTVIKPSLFEVLPEVTYSINEGV